MQLLFKMQKTLFSFSVTLILKAGIPDIPKFSWEMLMGPWYYKTSEECRGIRKIRTHMWTVWLITCLQAYFAPLNTCKKDKVQVPQKDEMLRLYCTVLGFISKNMRKSTTKHYINS